MVIWDSRPLVGSVRHHRLAQENTVTMTIFCTGDTPAILFLEPPGSYTRRHLDQVQLITLPWRIRSRESSQLSLIDSSSLTSSRMRTSIRIRDPVRMRPSHLRPLSVAVSFSASSFVTSIAQQVCHFRTTSRPSMKILDLPTILSIEIRFREAREWILSTRLTVRRDVSL